MSGESVVTPPKARKLHDALARHCTDVYKRQIHGCAGKLHTPAAPLHGHNDHRVVMSLTVLALAAGLPLSIDDAEAVQKSWPHFFEAIKPLGAEVEYAG